MDRPRDWWEDGIATDIFKTLVALERNSRNQNGRESTTKLLHSNAMLDRETLVEFMEWSGSVGLCSSERVRPFDLVVIHCAVYLFDMTLSRWYIGSSPSNTKIARLHLRTDTSTFVTIDSLLFCLACLRLAVKYEDVEQRVPSLKSLLNMLKRWTDEVEGSIRRKEIEPPDGLRLSCNGRSVAARARKIGRFEAHILTVRDWHIHHNSPPVFVSYFLWDSSVGNCGVTAAVVCGQSQGETTRGGFSAPMIGCAVEEGGTGDALLAGDFEGLHQVCRDRESSSSSDSEFVCGGRPSAASVDAAASFFRHFDTPPVEAPYTSHDADLLLAELKELVDLQMVVCLRDWQLSRIIPPSIVAASAVAIGRWLLSLPLASPALSAYIAGSLDTANSIGSCAVKLLWQLMKENRVGPRGRLTSMSELQLHRYRNFPTRGRSSEQECKGFVNRFFADFHIDIFGIPLSRGLQQLKASQMDRKSLKRPIQQSNVVFDSMVSGAAWGRGFETPVSKQPRLDGNLAYEEDFEPPSTSRVGPKDPGGSGPGHMDDGTTMTNKGGLIRSWGAPIYPPPLQPPVFTPAPPPPPLYTPAPSFVPANRITSGIIPQQRTAHLPPDLMSQLANYGRGQNCWAMSAGDLVLPIPQRPVQQVVLPPTPGWHGGAPYCWDFLDHTSRNQEQQAVTSYSQPMTSYSQPMTSYSQPVTSYSQPVTSYSQPVTSYSQPVTSYSQPMTSYSQPMTSYSQPVTSFSHNMNNTAQTNAQVSAANSTNTSSSRYLSSSPRVLPIRLMTRGQGSGVRFRLASNYTAASGGLGSVFPAALVATANAVAANLGTANSGFSAALTGSAASLGTGNPGFSAALTGSAASLGTGNSGFSAALTGSAASLGTGNSGFSAALTGSAASLGTGNSGFSAALTGSAASLGTGNSGFSAALTGSAASLGTGNSGFSAALTGSAASLGTGNSGFSAALTGSAASLGTGNSGFSAALTGSAASLGTGNPGFSAALTGSAASLGTGNSGFSAALTGSAASLGTGNSGFSAALTGSAANLGTANLGNHCNNDNGNILCSHDSLRAFFEGFPILQSQQAASPRNF